MKIERYQVYKDSGLEWLGEVPEHWEIQRIKDFSSVVRGGSPRPAGDLRFYEGDIPFLKVGDLTSNEELYLSTYTHTIKKAGLTNTRFISKNTLLLTNSGATLGIPKICTFPTTFNDGIAAFLHLKNIHQVFLFYFLKNRTKWYLNQASLGQGQPNLNTEIIGNTFISCPPFPEQKTIANYLDTKTAQIDRKIDLLTQKATLYGNLKQSLINETVTRGLDKSVPMKDSGIEWLGEIPEHWETSRIKNLGILSRGVDLPRDNFVEGDFPVYGSNGIIGYHSNCTTKAPCLTLGRSGSVGEVNYVSEDFWAHNTSLYLQQNFDNNIKFIFYLFKSLNLQSFSAGSAVATLNRNVIHQLKIAIPPTSEQKAIANYLDTKTAQIDQIIQTINTQIEKLKEFRKTLINDVVTGKIKV